MNSGDEMDTSSSSCSQSSSLSSSKPGSLPRAQNREPILSSTPWMCGLVDVEVECMISRARDSFSRPESWPPPHPSLRPPRGARATPPVPKSGGGCEDDPSSPHQAAQPHMKTGRNSTEEWASCRSGRDERLTAGSPAKDWPEIGIAGENTRELELVILSASGVPAKPNSASLNIS
ncbi:hypothetical protein C2845_PM11G18600 [Panicum miliaceum]|uniref:Uncharacterized protein n=1 Tax=Panicum miliaceum TaxID=4540 RepID=A0A3L6RRJ0_PANMI|nr:hypothetical protein C2845_PM11G18600 [Panicum miliaceum]